MEHATEHGVKQRLLAQPVAREQKAAFAIVGDRERKHAVQTLDTPLAVLFIRVHNHFGIGLGAEPVTACLELSAQSPMVVDLSVKHNPDGVILVGHRLVATSAVDNRQTAVAKCKPGRAVNGAPIRTAMP